MTLPTDPRGEQARIPQQATAAETPAVDTAATTRRRRWPWIVAAAAVALTATALLFPRFFTSIPDIAVERCQSTITEKLRSPSTAKFSDVTVNSSDGDFGSYFDVSGQVDAQNGFGAMVRGDYRCKVTLERDGRWLITESTLTNR